MSGGAPPVPDLLQRGVRQTPARVAVTQGARAFTYAALHARAAGTVAALRAAGVGPGDRVALLAANRIEFTELQVACQRAGAILTPLNYRLAAAELAAIAADCEPALLVVDADHAATDLDVPLRWTLGPEHEARLQHAAADADLRLGVLDPGAPGQLMYTSGTTGRPKGTLVSSGALHARVVAIAMALQIQPGDVFLLALPLFHIAHSLCFAHLLLGAATVTTAVFEPAGWLQAVEDHAVTGAMLAPAMIAMLLEPRAAHPGDLGSLRWMLYGASPISPPALTAAMDAFGCAFMQMYGMTEAGAATFLRADEHDPAGRPELLRAAGHALMGYELEVARSDGSRCPPGETGEILVRSPGNLSGYWRNAEATADALRGGWLHTGDAGHLDEEGRLYVTDRIKDMVITGGENVYCREVEDALAAHPGVRDVAVIGLPDARWGQRVHAIVVPHAALDEAALDAHCRERLAGYKRPRSYEAVQALPRNAAGKVLKHVLRAERP